MGEAWYTNVVYMGRVASNAVNSRDTERKALSVHGKTLQHLGGNRDFGELIEPLSDIMHNFGNFTTTETRVKSV